MSEEIERLRAENLALRAILSRLETAARRRMIAEDPTADERLELLHACEAAAEAAK